jgi:6-phosphogluconate dehydrogenase
MVGLGKMGGNMSRRLHDHGHQVIGFDMNQMQIEDVSANLAGSANSISELIDKLPKPRVVWVMVPAGDPIDKTMAQLARLLDSGDIVIDGGNTFYKESQMHSEMLGKKGIHFLDIGVSGGIWGLAEGYCLMAGGESETLEQIGPILDALSCEGGFAHVGPAGAGHFTKMVHNGVEYAMLEAYGEGFELLNASPFDLDLRQVASVWMHGSVVRSWLLELAETAFHRNPNLSGIAGRVEDTGEGRWTVESAVEMAVPVPVIAEALFARFRSREAESFSGKVIAALRHEFGGHKLLFEPTSEMETRTDEEKAA